MPIEIHQIIRSKRRTLAIIIKTDGTVTVRAPVKTTDRAIYEFVAQHTSWIEKKRAQLQSAFVIPPKEYVPGETFMFLGEPHQLEIVKRQKHSLVLNGTFKLSESATDRAEIVFERWYREQARRILQERVEWYACQFAFQYEGMKITSAKTRWGSCSSKGSLSFSWRLILAPMEQVEYVVVHELVHTIHHNHSRRYWNKLEAVMPDYRERKKWLRKHGPQLMI